VCPIRSDCESEVLDRVLVETTRKNSKERTEVAGEWLGSAAGHSLTKQCHIDLKCSGQRNAPIPDHAPYPTALSPYDTFALLKLRCLLK
jgi:hypothetical protein